MPKVGKAKDRKFTDIDTNGIGTTTKIVKLSATVSVPAKYRAPSSTEAFKNLVARAEGPTLSTLYLAVIRGIEAATAAKIRTENVTTVTIGGKKRDLMEFPVEVAVRAINARMSNNALLSVQDEDDSAEDFAETIKKMRKKDVAWYNASRMLVAGGKATVQGDEEDAVLTAVAPA